MVLLELLLRPRSSAPAPKQKDLKRTTVVKGETFSRSAKTPPDVS